MTSTNGSGVTKVPRAYALGAEHVAIIEAHAKAQGLNKSAALRDIINRWAADRKAEAEVEVTAATIPDYPDYTITPQGEVTNGNGYRIKPKRGKFVTLTNRRGKRTHCRISDLIELTYGAPRQPLTRAQRVEAKRDAILKAAERENSTVHMLADDLVTGVKARRLHVRFSENDALEVLGAIGMMLQEAR